MNDHRDVDMINMQNYWDNGHNPVIADHFAALRIAARQKAAEDRARTRAQMAALAGASGGIVKPAE